MTSIEIELENMNGETAIGHIRYAELDDSYTLHLIFNEDTYSDFGTDYFDSFCKIRRKLDALGWRPKCQGARRDVYPSGMCRDMGRGLKAYVMVLGSHNCSLVNIFDPITDNQPVSPDEQRTAFYEWLSSRGIKP